MQDNVNRTVKITKPGSHRISILLRYCILIFSFLTFLVSFADNMSGKSQAPMFFKWNSMCQKVAFGLYFPKLIVVIL